MANDAHLAKLRQGVEAWNRWRQDSPETRPDLREANLSAENLSNANLTGADLYEANLTKADLSGAFLTNAKLDCANLWRATLDKAKLTEATLVEANLSGANLNAADLRGADLFGACLMDAKLQEADLTGAELSLTNLLCADLTRAQLVRVNLHGASLVKAVLKGTVLDESTVYGTSIWDVVVDEATSQRDLIINPGDQDTVRVDDLRVAQFIYLLLKNEQVRHVIDTITSKVVLILGRFTEERKAVLNALRKELRKHDFTPILFDFDKPVSRTLTETVSTLAHLACFVIADITDAKSIPHELMKIIPNLPSLPVQPILLKGQIEYAMFKDFADYPSVLKPYRYQNIDELLESLEKCVIGAALKRAKDIEERRAEFEQELAGS